MNGKCYLVGTPIGNLGDITLRALETLKTVDIIAAEDTRHTLPLLSRYEIRKPLMSYHKYNENESAEKIKNILNEGKSVAIVTDCGMPCISDPGAVLVNALRADGYEITVIPGASAVTSAASLAGITENGFVFLGFLPEKAKDKKQIISAFKSSPLPLILYCAPHDLDKITAFLYAEFGERGLVTVKEITKIYETVYNGTLSSPNIENKKGEFVLIVRPDCKNNDKTDENYIKDALKASIADGMSKKEAVKAVSESLNIPKNTVYSAALNLEKTE